MARLENKPTWELWNLPRDQWLKFYETSRTVNYYKVGIALMRMANCRFFERHTAGEIINDQLYKERASTIEFYRKRMNEAKKER